MKRLLVILILTICFQSSTKADDIRDFEIEGISVGDSLLNYYSEKEIKKNIEIPSFKNKKFVPVYVEKIKKLDLYDSLDVWILDGDNSYKIYSVEGRINIYGTLNDCYKKQDEIINEIREIFDNNNVKERGIDIRKHSGDKSGKSTIRDNLFEFKNKDAVQISCLDYGKNVLGKDSISLSIAADTKKFGDFLSNEAWK